MGLFKDLFKLFKEHRVIFVERRQEAGDAISFYFKPEGPLEWIPGQHAILTVSRQKLVGGSTRAFSVASTPEEGNMMISARVPAGPSAYKQTLLNLKPGDTVFVRGPVGAFYSTDVNRPAVYIAGGIGITPYRALLQEAAVKTPGRALHLLYGDSRGSFVLREDLERLKERTGNTHIRYIRDNNELMEEVKAHAAKYGNTADYFVSGPPAMVKAVKETLKALGIGKKSIKADPFMGYK